MKELKYSDLPELLTEDIVRILRKMAESQSDNWIDILNKMTFEQKQMYLDIKSKQIKEESDFESQRNITQEEYDNKFKSWWIRFVNVDRNPSDLTIEDEIEAISDEDFYTKEKITELFTYKARNRILLRRENLHNEKFSFFLATKSPFSQWHKSPFKASSFLFANSDNERKRLLDKIIDAEEIEFSSAEQFMMYQKAMLFLDREIALEILKTSNVKTIKELGRKVKNYDETVWKYNRCLIVYMGNKAKFSQNLALKEALFATKGTTLVEAAPNDTIWGIGLTEDDPKAKKRETWQGKNLLGEILTQLRVDLMGGY